MAGKVFISFKTSDTPRVRPVYDALRAEGYEVFWSNDIPPGSVDYQAVIKAELSKADAVVVVWTNDSVRSHPVAQEAAQAEKWGKLFQIVCDDIEPIDFPMEARFKAQKVMLINWAGDGSSQNWLALVAALRRRVQLNSGGSEGQQLAFEPAYGRHEAQTPLFPTKPASWRRLGLSVVVPAIVLGAVGFALRLNKDFRGALPEETEKSQEASAGHDAALRNAWSASAGKALQDCPDVCPELVVLPNDNFTMGSPDTEADRIYDESPRQVVKVTKPVAAGKYEITVGQFKAFARDSGFVAAPECEIVVGENTPKRAATFESPNFEQTDRNPVVCVSWTEAKAYTSWLSKRTGKRYRLLTEVEWEFAARSGTSTPFWTGTIMTADLANYNASTSYNRSPIGIFRGRTTEVGTFGPNLYGLFDVHGNVWEWVEDCYRSSLEANTTQSANLNGDCNLRVLRGGSWSNEPSKIRSAFRSRRPFDLRRNNIGFRVARDLD